MKHRLIPICLALASVSVQAHPCADIGPSEARLACYDKAFPPRAATPAAAKPEPMQRFGLPPERPPETAETSTLRAALRAVEYRPDGSRLFVLDNDQRWLETDTQRRGVIEAGDRIEIKRGSFGSFMLVTPARVGIRVRRLQ